MNASEISNGLGKISTIELSPAYVDYFPDDFKTGNMVEIENSPKEGAILRTRTQNLAVRGFDARAKQRLEDLLHQNNPSICWISRTVANVQECNALHVQLHEFQEQRSWSEPLKFNIDADTYDKLRKTLKVNTFIEVEQVLRNEFVIEPLISGHFQRIIVTASSANSKGKSSSFRIYGVHYIADVENRPQEINNTTGNALFIRRIFAKGIDFKNLVQTIIQAPIIFHDLSLSSATAEMRSSLDIIVQQSDSYLSLWKTYNDIEKRNLDADAAEFGSLHYTKYKWRSDGDIEFDFDKNNSFTIGLLNYCKDERQSLQAQLSPRIFDNTKSMENSDRRFIAEIIDITSGRVVLRTRGDVPDPPMEGFLSVSQFGDTARLERRERARDKIARALSEMPRLGMLLEGKSIPSTKRKQHQILSPSAKKIFHGNPTPAQEMAIGIGLNTPDIALIQGPPGTGKTRVIAALQIRLAEISDGEHGFCNETRLTSYQHDAVDNVAAACTVFGLPAFRVKSRAVAGQGTNPSEHWRRNLISKLKASNATANQIPIFTASRNIDRLVETYMQAPSTPASDIQLLQNVLQNVESWINSKLIGQLKSLIKQHTHPILAAEMPIEKELALNAIKNLPTTPKSALDDGPKRAKKALIAIEKLGGEFLSDLEHAILSGLAEWDGSGDPGSLILIADLKTVLIDRITPAPIHSSSPIHNTEFEELLFQVRAEMKEQASRTPFSALVAVEELIDELEANPDSINEELAKYSASLASTVQQAVGKEMVHIKVGDTGTNAGWPTFRSVIVDEAARCNPLDLMIPLCCAQRRIVLVGDHRQLPHVLEKSVERDLAISGNDTKDALGQSLFERLVKHVQVLEASDGIKRYVRRDTQYRMPPSLGNFISAAFYEPYNEPFDSARPESDLPHGLPTPYENKRGAWIDLPYEQGPETSQRSKSRYVEARWIANEIKSKLESRPDLSIGVITFYVEQVDEIYKALEQVGIVERGGGQWKIKPAWKTTSVDSEESRDRLRVGTVDAFQGMQFDIVYLSLVRSNNVPPIDLSSIRKKYGFLLIENRICVAMSRQERFLIVVGDSHMVMHPEVEHEPGISQLRKFYSEFCGGPHGIRIR